MDRRIGAASAGMCALHRPFVVKRELSRKAKPTIYRSIYIPIITYGHKLWVVTERTRSQIPAAKMILPLQGGWAQPWGEELRHPFDIFVSKGVS